jgi:2-polyprenyl-3-methyl-5-hydroxy-6-metoxy-1,4-benzoquinol methylase
MEIQAITTGLFLGEDGVWYSHGKQNVSYPENGSDICFAVEEHSFWFKHRNDCVVAAALQYPPTDEERTIVDVGGGNGYVARGLAHADFDVILIEPGQKGSHNAKQRGLKKVVCGTTESARVRPGSLPAIGLFDVLEHINDDVAFLVACRDLLREAGRLYLTVPAYQVLWSSEDVVAQHYRRYRMGSLINMLQRVGFHIEYSTYIFRMLPLPIALFRTFPYRVGLSEKGGEEHAERDHNIHHPFFSRMIDVLLRTEKRNVAKGKAMAFGGSCLVVATKSGI